MHDKRAIYRPDAAPINNQGAMSRLMQEFTPLFLFGSWTLEALEKMSQTITFIKLIFQNCGNNVLNYQ
jgi:hypothetical protein